jgi:PAS domain S-box-containing protein
MERLSTFHQLKLMMISTISYYGVALLSMVVLVDDASAPFFWAASGILLGLMLCSPRSSWKWILLGFFPGNIAANMTIGVPFYLGLAFALAHTVEALVAATLIRRYGGFPYRLDSLQNVALLTLGGGAIGGSVSASLCMLVWIPFIEPESLPIIWSYGFGAVFCAIITITPLFLLIDEDKSKTESTKYPLWETTAIVLGLFAITFWEFRFFENSNDPTFNFTAPLFLSFPFLIIASMRYGPKGAALSAAWMALVAVFSSVGTHGPFTLAGELNNYHLGWLYSFITIVSLTCLGLGAIVAERNAAEAQQTKNSQRLDSALETGNIGFWDWNLMEKTVEFSEGWMRQLGFEHNELPHQFSTWEERVHPEDLPRMVKAIDQFITGESDKYEEEHRLKSKDGDWVWILTRGKIVERDDNDEPLRMMGTHLDITRLKETEWELREARIARERAEDVSLLMVCEIDLNGRWRKVPQPLVDLLGVQPKELIGTPIESWVTVPDDIETEAKTRRQLLRGDVPSAVLTTRLKRTSATPVPVELSYSLARGSNDEPLFLLAHLRDLTSLLDAEEEKRRLEQQMQHAQKLESLGVLAGGLAHDFNNLLVAILGNASLARMDLPQSSVAIEAIEQVENAANRAADMANQMLAYTGRGRYKIDQVDLNQIITEVSNLMEVSITKKARLELKLEPELPVMNADQTQLQQVILNLVTNASDALKENGGLISITTNQVEFAKPQQFQVPLSTELQPGRYVTLEVLDTGCGMNADELARIFDPFFTQKDNGRGLGLAAVLGIVRSHNGAIRVSSTQGIGTKFHIYFPCHPDYTPIEIETPTTDTNKSDDIWMNDGTILIADDVLSVSAFARRALERAGFHVLMAHDGHDALEQYQNNSERIDGILLDSNMPLLSGEEVYNEIRAQNEEVVIVLSSGYETSESLQRLTDDDYTDFLKKPYNAVELVSLIHHMLLKKALEI